MNVIKNQTIMNNIITAAIRSRLFDYCLNHRSRRRRQMTLLMVRRLSTFLFGGGKGSSDANAKCSGQPRWLPLLPNRKRQPLRNTQSGGGGNFSIESMQHFLTWIKIHVATSSFAPRSFHPLHFPPILSIYSKRNSDCSCFHISLVNKAHHSFKVAPFIYHLRPPDNHISSLLYHRQTFTQTLCKFSACTRKQSENIEGKSNGRPYTIRNPLLTI